MSFFCSRTLSRRPCYIMCHISLNAFWLWQFLRLSLCGWPWPFWGVLVRCFVERPSTGVYHVFLMTRPGSLGFGRKTTGIQSAISWHPTNTAYYLRGSSLVLTLNTWLRWCFPGSSTLKFPSCPSSPYGTLWKGRTLGRTLRMGGTPQSWRAE